MRRPETLGATPSIAMTVTALTVIATTCVALGVLHPKTATAATPQAAVTAPADDTITGADTPARAALVTFLGKDLTWGVKIPTRFGCHAPTAAISASNTDGTTAQVFLAGQAVPALDSLTSCGSRTQVNGTPAVKMTAVGGVVTAWTRGDVLVTVSAPTSDPAQLTDVDNHLTAALAGVCANLNPTAGDATRNPVNSGYTPYTTQLTVNAPAPTAAPTPATPAPTPTPTAAPTPMPAPTGLPATPPTGVSGPPLPSPVPSPTAPTSPGDEPTQAVITVAAADPTGPGCGWAFTGQTAPKTDAAALDKASQQAQDNARLDLLTRQQKWAADRSAYAQAVTTYATAVTAWNAYATAVADTVSQWTAQKAALDTYQRLLDDYNSAANARSAFLAQQQQSQTTYNEQVMACAAGASTGASGASTPTPSVSPTASATPSPSPTSALVCPATRPAILDQPAPTVPPQPTAPALWSPGQPNTNVTPAASPQPTTKR